MTVRRVGPALLSLVLGLSVLVPSSAVTIAYLTAANAAAAAYQTATDAATAALVTATDASTAAALTAQTAADAARTTAVNAAEAAYSVALNAGGGTCPFPVLVHCADTPATASALSAAQAQYATAIQAADASHLAAVNLASSQYGLATQAAQAAYAASNADTQATCVGAMTAAILTESPPASAEELATNVATVCPTTPDPVAASPWTQSSPNRLALSPATALPRPVSPPHQWAGTLIEQAYARRHAVLDSTGRQPLALTSGAGLFPAYGFSPPSSVGSWAIKGIDDNRSDLCITKTVATVEQWRTELTILTENKLSAALADCTPQSTFPLPAKDSFPFTLSAHKVLDRRNYPVATTVPGYPELLGVPAGVALPSFTLVSAPGAQSEPATILVYNTPTLISTVPVVQYLQTGVSEITVRPGFTAEHNCTTLLGGQTCTVLVRYSGDTAAPAKVGNLRIEFATGEFAVISLLGLTSGY
jgi:hypothetical protein